MIIGLSGKRGVGKTVVAKYLAKNHGFILTSFAYELKKLAKELFPFDNEHFTDTGLKESPFGPYEWTPRDFLIGLGKFMREYDKDYWAKMVLDYCSQDFDYVIDDVRFQNEYNLIKARGGKLIRIERPEELNVFGSNLDDPSETALDNVKRWEGKINNDGSYDLLYANTNAIVTKLLEKNKCLKKSSSTCATCAPKEATTKKTSTSSQPSTLPV